MGILKSAYESVTHLFYPHICTGCGSDILNNGALLCLRCLHRLPHTGFEKYPLNPVERIFIGRVNIQAAYSEFYFAKGQLIQQLIHRLKYKNDMGVGEYLGQMMGNNIIHSERFKMIDYLIPLPLYPDKEFKRGYNQAEVLCRGISQETNIPVLSKNLIRRRETETQTRKHRSERWLNVDGSFALTQPDTLNYKKILLIDDVITTGATLEACCQALQKITTLEIFVASLAVALR